MDPWLLAWAGILVIFYVFWSMFKSSRAETSLIAKRDLPYIDGLNFILNDQPDRAVEAFMSSLDVNTDTLETHLSLGKLMRRQGHVDRAIRIHQNVLARPSLSQQDVHRVHLELAKDFMYAGLFDRAEMLLKEVISESVDYRYIAQRKLLDIYQDEREWELAIDVAKNLQQKKYVRGAGEDKKYIARMISHFYAELAEAALEKFEFDKANDWLIKATATDKTGVRIAVLNASRLNYENNFKAAIKLLSKFGMDNPAWFSACLPTLLESFEGLHGEQSAHTLRAFLEERSPNGLSAAEAVFIANAYIEQKTSVSIQEAKKVLLGFLAKNDNLAISNLLLGLDLQTAGGNNMPFKNLGVESNKHIEKTDVESMNIENMDIEKNTDKQAYLKQLHHNLDNYLANQKLYRCENCGFSGRKLNWRCPSCRRWDSSQRIDETTIEC